MNTTTHIDYGECRKRLQAITTDAAALDSFERVAQSGEVNEETAAFQTQRQAVPKVAV